MIKKTLYIQVFLFVSHVVSSTFELHTASLHGVSNRIGMGEELSDVDSIQLSLEGEVNSGGYIPRREASRYISTALHRP